MPRIGLDLNIDPNMFTWARTFIGLSQEDAAQRLDMSVLDLRYIEEGGEGVDYPMLAKFAAVYDQPELTFFLPEPPTIGDYPVEFRGLSLPDGADWSYELRTEYRRVIRQRKHLIDIFDENEDRESFPPLPSINQGDDIEAIGVQLREWLGAATISEPGDGYSRFNQWVSLIEAYGILVTQVRGISTEEMRGFSVFGLPYPAIAINVQDNIYARIFTLMHELAHILLGQSTVDAESYRSGGIHQATERFCNSLAACILLPEQVLNAQLEAFGSASPSTWDRGQLVRVGHSLGVSGEALLLRLVSLGLASWDEHRQYRGHVNDEERSQAMTASGGDYYRNQMRWKGRLYLRTVVDALDRNLITDPEFTRFTDIKTKRLPMLKEKMGIA